MKNTTERWKLWEGQWVDGKFPLRVWLDGSDHSAVFLTELRSQPSQKAAIKLIPADSPDPERELSRWRRAAQLSHPHLLRIFEIGRAQIENTPLLYMVMEYADEDLSQILPQRPLTSAEAGELLPPVLEALSYLHANGLVHCHLQPSNVFAVKNEVKLSSDGISPAGEPADKIQNPTAYDAPEIASEPVSPATDVWSLGITLVEALTQRIPGYDKKVPDGPEIPSAVPEPFRNIVRECLHRDPKRRLAIADLKARLGSALSPIPATRQVPSEKKRAAWRIATIAAVILLLALLGQRLLRKSASPDTSTKTESAASDSRDTSPPKPASQPADKPPKAVDSAGAVARQVLPDVPRSARNTIQGKIRVIVRTEVDSSGKVTDATLTSPGPSKYFANLALNAAKRWEFTPPQVDGRAVPSAWLLRFRFGRDATEVSPAPASP